MGKLRSAVRIYLAAGLSVAVLLGLGVSLTLAHGSKPHWAAPDRPELSFGRSETHDYDPPAPGSYRLPPIRRAADGRVLDTRGSERRLRALMDDRITVLAFIYTRCSDPQGCPLSMSLLHDLQYVAREDPDIGDNLRLIAMSFDIEHDTPEILAEYDAGARGDPGGIAFTTAASRGDLMPLLKAYDQPIGRKLDAADPYGPYTHQLRVFLIDRLGQVRNIYSLGFLDPRLVATDIRTLLIEERSEAPGD